MQCPRCQQEYPTSPNFCAECGTPRPTTGGSPGASYVDLERALSEALEQQTATSEILRVISNSPTDAQPVFDVIVRNAARLCHAVMAAVLVTDGRMLYPTVYLCAPHASRLVGPLPSSFPGPRFDPSLTIWQDRRDDTASSALWEGPARAGP